MRILFLQQIERLPALSEPSFRFLLKKTVERNKPSALSEGDFQASLSVVYPVLDGVGWRISGNKRFFVIKNEGSGRGKHQKTKKK